MSFKNQGEPGERVLSRSPVDKKKAAKKFRHQATHTKAANMRDGVGPAQRGGYRL